MTKINLQKLSIRKVRELLISGDISCRELVEIYHDQIKKNDKNIKAYLEVFNSSYQMAEKEDKRIKEGGTPKALSGIPFAIKDNILIKGEKVSAGSQILKSYSASYDAYAIQKLRDAGAVFLGRTNMDEFAMGASGENSSYGSTKNPYDLTRVPGGSSSGSAAAVATGMCLAALGSDTAGSVRQPASFCGVVGLKPTYGAVSRSGLISMASSLDQIGPFAKNIDDTKMIFEIIKGKDKKDSTSVECGAKKCFRMPIVGVPREYFSLKDKGIEGMDEDVSKVISKSIEELKSAGYEIKEISLPHADYALSCYYIIMPAEVSSNLARFDGVRYGHRAKGDKLFEIYQNTRGEEFGKEVRSRIILGTFVLSAGYYEAYYARAQKVRQLIRKDFQNAFQDVDVLLAPTAPTPAFKIGEKAQDPLSMYLSDVFTASVNLAGVPAISLPFGNVEREGKSLPVGVQLIAPWFYEETLFSVGKVLENNS